jgi:hypothetical protein
MKTFLLYLAVFIISFPYCYSQSRGNGTSKRTDDKADVEKAPVREIQRTPPPIIDRDTRSKPPGPPVRPPVNNNSPTPPTGRTDPPPTTTIQEPPVFIKYVPIPDDYYPAPMEPIYDYPIVTTPSTNIVIDYKSLGLRQFRDEDYYNALASFQIALAQDSTQYSIYYNLGVTEIEIGRYDDAIYSLTKFIDNVIENRMGFYQRGLAYFYAGDKDSALDDFIIADKYKVDEAKVILKRFYNF